MASKCLVILGVELCFAVIIFSSLTVHETRAFSTTYSAKCFSANVTQLLDSLLANYDRRIRPGHGGPPTTIGVNMNVRSMGPFSEKQESYAMQLYLRQVWYDPRLKFNRALWGRSEFSMNWMFADKLWKPDTFFINGKNSYFHQITAPNMFIRLRHDGQITWSMRLTVRATCLMHLRKFPLDTQHCPLKMASYGYNAQDIMYRWDPSKLVTVDSDVSIAQYELVNISTHMDKVTIRRKEQISTLTVKFHLRRQTGFFLLQVYVPCILIVCCSWVAFWITKKDVPGRVGLGANGVLSMTKLSFGGRSNWPEVSYATALDYFICLCFVFVFGTIVEFATVHTLERFAVRRRKQLVECREKKVAALKAEQERAARSGKTGGIVVEEGKPLIKDSLRHVLKIPLSVVPLAEEEAVIEVPGEPQTGDAKEGFKSLMKMPLTVLPQTADAIKMADDESEVEVPGDGKKDIQEGLRRTRKTPLTILPLSSDVASGVDEESQTDTSSDPKKGPQSLGKQFLTTTLKNIQVLKAEEGHWLLPGSKQKEEALEEAQKAKSRKGKSDSFEKIEVEKEERSPTTSSEKEGKEKGGSPSIIVDVSDEEPPPPPPHQVTIWQLLMQKKKLMLNMTPSFIIPGEEDILDKFSIVDLYARRIFPSLFFFFITVYWIMFNFYITDEFPNEKKTPSDGLVVT